MKSIERGLQILEILANSKSSCGVTEIANIMKLDKSIVFRNLNTMKRSGYVEQSKEQKKYTLGLKILELSNRLIQKMEITTIARPMLEKLSHISGETSHLAVLRDGRVIYIDRVESKEILGIHTNVGDHEPLYCTAVGKAILAFLPPKEVQEILKELNLSGFEKFTDDTITSLSELEIELENIRKKGFALDNEELYKGVRCIAAPIKNHENEVIASLGISGPTSRMMKHKIVRLAALTKEIAGEISEGLGNLS